MTIEKHSWEYFCERASTIMREALDNKITLEEATAFFENENLLSNADLRQYIIRAVCEIDGNRKYYMELLERFDSRASEEELIRYINS